MYLLLLIRIGQVVGTYQSTVGNDLRGPVLLFTQPRTPVGLLVIIPVRGDLHEVEGDLSQSELRAPLVHQQFHALTILVAGVSHIRTTLVVEDALHRIVEDGMERAVAPQHSPVIIPLRLEVHDTHRVGRLLSVFLQILLGQPTLHARAALVGHDESYRDVEGTVHHLGEEIPRGRGIAHGLRTHLFPLALGILLR